MMAELYIVKTYSQWYDVCRIH